MPVAYGYRDVLVRGYVDEVVIQLRVPRSSPSTHVPTRGTTSFTTPSATYHSWRGNRAPWGQAAPLQGWELPDEFGTLRRLLESRMGRRGKREYLQVLRLLETFSQQEVAAAVKDAIHLGALSFDTVKHLLLCRLEGRPPRLDL